MRPIGLRPRGGGLASLRQPVAFVDPDLHADSTEGRGRLGLAVVDVGTHCVEWHATLHGALGAGHLDAAEPARDRRHAALGSARHCARDRLPEGAPEGDSALELIGDVAGNQGRLQLRHADFLDVHPNAFFRQRFQFAT